MNKQLSNASVVTILAFSILTFGAAANQAQYHDALMGKLLALEDKFHNANKPAAETYARALANLETHLAGAFEREEKKAAESGDTGAAAIYHRAGERLAAGEGVLAKAQERATAGLPPTVITLNNTYRREHARFESARDRMTAPLLRKWLRALTSLEETALRDGNDVDAYRIRSLCQTLDAKGLFYVAQSRPAAVPLSVALAGHYLSPNHLPSGRVYGFGKDSGGSAVVADADCRLREFKEIENAVRVFRVPHFRFVLSADGKRYGHDAPAEERNRGIRKFTLAYYTALYLYEDGGVKNKPSLDRPLPAELGIDELTDAIDVVTAGKSAAILRRKGEIVAFHDDPGSSGKIVRLKLPRGTPDDLVELHAFGELILGRRANGSFSSVYPPGDHEVIEFLNSRLPVREVASIPSASHLLAVRADGSVVAWSSGRIDSAAQVPTGLPPALDVRVGGGGFSAARLADGSWRAWGNPAAGVVEKVNTFGPEVHDLTAIGHDDGTSMSVTWIQ